MNRTKIYYKKGAKFKSPIMIVGLPGIGSVGSLVAEYLRNELGAKRFATLYSPHFIHQTIMLKSGYTRLISNRFYSKDTKNGTVIILLLSLHLSQEHQSLPLCMLHVPCASLQT